MHVLERVADGKQRGHGAKCLMAGSLLWYRLSNWTVVDVRRVK